CVGLIAFYAGHALGAMRRGLLFGALLGALYAVLYVLLLSEDYALLLGSLLLFGVLALIMVLTRRVKWYRLPGAEDDRQPSASGDRHGGSVRVKVNIAELLRQELARPSWRRETVVIGAATDPYQPVEGRYRLTRPCLEALADHRTPLGIITRGTLIVRDVDVL